MRHEVTMSLTVVYNCNRRASALMELCPQLSVAPLHTPTPQVERSHLDHRVGYPYLGRE